MEHKRSGAGGSGSDSELNKRTPEGSRLSGGFLCCTNFTRPTGNLDSASTEEIMGILKGLHEAGRSVILITHDNEIAEQAKRVVRILDGKIVEDYYNAEKKAQEV